MRANELEVAHPAASEQTQDLRRVLGAMARELWQHVGVRRCREGRDLRQNGFSEVLMKVVRALLERPQGGERVTAVLQSSQRRAEGLGFERHCGLFTIAHGDQSIFWPMSRDSIVDSLHIEAEVRYGPCRDYRGTRS